MDTASSNNEGRAIVIAGKYESFKVEAIHLLARHGVEVTFCDSLYDAAGVLAHVRENEQILVVGSLAELSREAGNFFQICSRRPEIRCLCFIRPEAEQPRKISDAVRRGILTASDIDDFHEAVDEWSKGLIVQQETASPNKAAWKKPAKKQSTLSKAELEALMKDY
jgi:hypothetical protein